MKSVQEIAFIFSVSLSGYVLLLKGCRMEAAPQRSEGIVNSRDRSRPELLLLTAPNTMHSPTSS